MHIPNDEKFYLWNPLKLNLEVRYYQYEFFTANIEFLSSGNVKFALKATSTPQPTDHKREELPYKSSMLLQSISFIPVQTFILYLLHQHELLNLWPTNHFDSQSYDC